jgi:hypothetical protein
MKKEYVKPEVEIVELVIADTLTVDDLSSDMGLGDEIED